MHLEECRERIDAIDTEILRLLNSRAGLSERIGQIKARAGLPIIDSRREDNILQRIVRDSEICPDAIERIYGEILSESRRIQLAISAPAATNDEVCR